MGGGRPFVGDTSFETIALPRFALVATATAIRRRLGLGFEDMDEMDCTMSGTVLSCHCAGGQDETAWARLDTCSCPSAADANGIYKNYGVLYCGPEKSSGSSTSGSSSGCDGCHGNGDCGSCERCKLSTCTCRSKAVCN